MLQNEPLVAKIGVDTAENEPIFGWIQLVQLSRFNSSILSLGKTMSLMTVLKRLPECELASLNFSSGTDAMTMIKTLELYCETVHRAELITGMCV